MDKVAGPKRPKFCQDCGGKLAERDRFCEACGGAIASGGDTPPPHASRADAEACKARARPGGAGRDAFVAALLLGGAWPLVNRLSSRPLRTWLPLPFGVLWVGAVAVCAVWWARYLFVPRWQIMEPDPTAFAQIVAWLGAMSMVASLPMAAKALDLLDGASAGRQATQARRAMALPIGVVAYLALTAAVSGSTIAAVGAARAAHEGRRSATEAQRRANEAEIDRAFPTLPKDGGTSGATP